jgi:type II secretion system protein C
MSRTAIWMANGVLSILCCFLVARILTEVAAGVLVPTPAVAFAPPPIAAPSQRGWERRQVIIERGLIAGGAEAEAAPVVEETPEELEQTELNLRLLATVAGAEETSWAAVDDLDARQVLVVRVGDPMKQSAEVVGIERRRIVLRNAGRLEELSLDESVGVPAKKGRPKARRQRGNSRAKVGKLGKDRFSLNRTDVQSMANNPAKLFSQARILPKYEDGQMKGVQLSAIKAGSLFEQIGLENGDVIVELNGIEINNQQDSAAVLRELTQAKEFDVRVIGSDGRERNPTYELR